MLYFGGKNMKCIKIFIVSVFITLILSCSDGDVFYKYYKAFYLGEDSVTISGTVFKDLYLTTPADFETIHAGIDPNEVDEWEVIGTINGSNFEIVLEKSSNGVVLSKETVKDNNKYVWGLKSGHIALIYFNTGTYNYPYALRGPYYKEQKAGQYDYIYYDYIYVAEPINLTRTETEEGHNFLGYEETIISYYDYNFDKVGWYKICGYNNPIGNDSKHSSGSNTYLYKEY
jgi:hypothetical protein